MADKAIEEISKGGHQLKHVETTDKSVPKIEEVQIKKVDRDPFLKEIAKGTDLSHPSDSNERSAPKIEDNIHVKQSDRGALLKDIESAKK